MRKSILLLTLSLLIMTFMLSAPGLAWAAGQASGAKQPAGAAKSAAAKPLQVKMETTLGAITLELYPDKAPKTVENFKKYVDEGFYNGTTFHRVIAGFMIQGGGMTTNKALKKTHAPIINEANNGLRNDVYTIAMARTPDPNSATSQFFINVKNNTFLNFTAETKKEWGYCVFGKVIAGKEVVDKIAAVPTYKQGDKGGDQDMPKTAVVINKVSIVSR